MADKDDYMSDLSYGDYVVEDIWDTLQQNINANRRFRIKGVAGGDYIEYSISKVIWTTDIYIFFTRESDGAWVYNKINANPTTGITCGNNDLLYVNLNDLSTSVLTVYAADYTAMPIDDTGRILILGAVSNSKWYSNTIGGSVGWENPAIEHLDMGGYNITNVGTVDGKDISAHVDASNPHSGSAAIADLHAEDHDNTHHTTNYEVANVNIQAHVASPASSAHHVRYANSEVEAVINAELVNGQSIDNAIDSLITTHKNDGSAHHAKYTLSDWETGTGISNGNLVDKSASETISGLWAFGTNFPTTPSSNPTTDYQVTNKKYVDDNAGVYIAAITPYKNLETLNGQPASLLFQDKYEDYPTTYDEDIPPYWKYTTTTEGAPDSNDFIKLENLTVAVGGYTGMALYWYSYADIITTRFIPPIGSAQPIVLRMENFYYDDTGVADRFNIRLYAIVYDTSLTTVIRRSVCTVMASHNVYYHYPAGVETDTGWGNPETLGWHTLTFYLNPQTYRVSDGKRTFYRIECTGKTAVTGDLDYQWDADDDLILGWMFEIGPNLSSGWDIKAYLRNMEIYGCNYQET